MGISVSKAKALVEMVRAFDAEDEQKAKRIGRVISKSIQKDSRNEKYEVIELDRYSKQLFPQKIRDRIKESDAKRDKKKNSIAVKMDDCNYLIEIKDEISIVPTKLKGEYMEEYSSLSSQKRKK